MGIVEGEVNKQRLMELLSGLPDSQAYVLIPVGLANKWFHSCTNCMSCDLKLTCREYAKLYNLLD